MFANRVSCMTASKDDLGSLLSSIVPRLWSFAFRLARNEYVAEQLVRQACAYWLEQDCYTADPRTPLIRILSCMQAMWLAEVHPCSQQAPDQHRLCGTRSVGNSANDTGKLEFVPADAISAIQNLSPLPRIVMLLVHAEGLTRQEAADVVGMPVRNVQQLILDARITIGSWARLGAPEMTRSLH
jgi:RNA polymerase sigma-70 factor, ECF subfamily